MAYIYRQILKRDNYIFDYCKNRHNSKESVIIAISDGIESAVAWIKEKDGTITAELLAALKLCASVCAGETMNKRGLVEALEAAQKAIANAEKKQP